MVKSNFVEDFSRFSDSQLMDVDPTVWEYAEVLRLVETLQTRLSDMYDLYEHVLNREARVTHLMEYEKEGRRP